MARVPQHDEQSLQEAERAEVVEVAAQPGGPLGSGGDVWLATEPGDQTVGLVQLAPSVGRR